MTNKYNVQLITDVNGKPMPQYYDETEGVMKPITRNNGEVTGDINANVSFPETQNVNGTVSVDNFPTTQQVEVTNQKEVQDVNVTNQATSVDVNNFPELQDVSDEQVRAELEQIKATQSQILERLDNPIDTQLTGSNVEELIDVNKNNQRKYLTNQVIQSGATKRFVYRVRNDRISVFLRTSEVANWAIYYRADPAEAGYIIDGFKEITTRESSSIGNGDINYPRYVFIEFEVRNLSDIPMTVKSVLITDMKGVNADGL